MVGDLIGAYERATELLAESAALDPDDPDRRQLRERAIALCLPAARRIARRYAGRGEPLDDLYQVAALGLVTAANRYSPAAGGSFAAFAVPTILGELRRHFRDHGWAMRVNRGLQELHLRINRAEPVLWQRLGREPSDADLAAHLSLSEPQVRAGRTCAGAYQATTLPVDDESGQIDPDLDAVPERVATRTLIERLPLRERQIIGWRFVEDLTQAQIGERLRLSQVQVSRILTRTIATLRLRLSD